MKADTASYVGLQRVYQAKAREDAAAFRAHVERIHAQLQATRVPSPAASPRPMQGVEASGDGAADAALPVSDAELARFCKHAGSLVALQYRSLRQEYSIEVQRDKFGGPFFHLSFPLQALFPG